MNTSEQDHSAGHGHRLDDVYEYAALTDDGEQYLISDDRALAAFTRKMQEEGRGYVCGTARAMFSTGLMSEARIL